MDLTITHLPKNILLFLLVVGHIHEKEVEKACKNCGFVAVANKK